MLTQNQAAVGLFAALLVGGCGLDLAPAALTTGSIDTHLPIRVAGTSVPQGHKARVFTFAGLGSDCSSTVQPRLIIDKAPTKGSVAFYPVEPTVVQYSLSGRCIGNRVAGTGVYYTPRPGETGPDTFTVSARAGGSTVATRKIDVKIIE
jgi:hypothetical protein